MLKLSKLIKLKTREHKQSVAAELPLKAYNAAARAMLHLAQ